MVEMWAVWWAVARVVQSVERMAGRWVVAKAERLVEMMAEPMVEMMVAAWVKTLAD